MGGVERPGSYVFQGRPVTLPCIVGDAFSLSATYLVKAAPARRLLPGTDLEVAEVLPGHALLSIACIDYRVCDLGDYNEVSIALFARKKGEGPRIPYFGTVVDFFRSRLPTCILHLPVNQSLSRDAGCGIWGFPKTLQEIEFSEDHRRCRLTMDKRHLLTFSMPAGSAGKVTIPETAMETFSYIAGRPYRTSFVSGAEGVAIKLAGSTVELGDHAVAGQLRSLGLPKRPLMSVWMERMYGRFERPQPL